MLLPIADVPRWYAERRPKDTIALSHGPDMLTWEQLERYANRRARTKMVDTLRFALPTDC
jgi:bile acid-coenzyme A ligase